MSDDEMNAFERQGVVQEKLDHLTRIGFRLEMAMDALRCPPRHGGEILSVASAAGGACRLLQN
jgi:hypothetical protein